MADTGLPPHDDSGQAGSVRGLLAAALSYAGARGKLLQIEAQEAGTHVGRVATCAVFAAGALMVAWLLAVPAIVILLADWVRRPWAHVALALAGLHLVAGFVMLLMARRRWRRARLFEETLNQFQKDHEWVAPNQSPPRK